MSKRIYFILYIFIGVGLSHSCTSGVNDMEFEYVTTVDKIDKGVSFDSIVDTYKYVKLETTPECLLGNVEQILFEEDKLFVVSDGVYCFDSTGKFQFAINSKGRGPGEFNVCSTVSISGGKIYLYDNLQNQILLFDSKNGGFLEQKQLPISAFMLYVVNDMLIYDIVDFAEIYAKNAERFLIFNYNNLHQLVNGFLSEKKYKRPRSGQITTTYDGIVFSDFYDNKAIKVKPDKVENLFLLVTPPEKSLTEAEKRDMIDGKNTSLNNTGVIGKIYGLHNVCETKKHIFSKVCLHNDFGYIYYDKLTDKNIFVTMIYSEPYQFPPLDICAVGGEVFCQILDTYSICSVKTHLGLGEPLPPDHPEYEAQQVLESVQPEDNPIIAFYKFRPIQ